MYERIDIAVKGGLLHDIGKIIFRNDRSSGNHSNAGASFIAEKLTNMENKEDIIECINYHHYGVLKNADLKKDSMAYIVYEANNIASGIDRRLIYEEPDSNQFFDEKTPLHSVFNLLHIHKNDRKGAYKLKPRFMEKGVLIPEEDIQSLKSTTTQDAYGEILEMVEKSLLEMSGSLDSSNSLLKLLEVTTSDIPSSTSTREIADTSIYDHSKVTSALASSMYIYAEGKEIKDYRKTFFESKAFRKEEAFLLLSGDVSGIQDFIYTIASKGALRSLRGRSLYLEVMVENIIDDILDEIGLTRANLVYSGGGHFYMLLPNTDRTKEIILKNKREINRQFLEMFSISLYIEMDYIQCTADEIANGLDIKIGKENLIGEIYAGVSRKISRNKLQRYKSGELAELFDPDSIFNRKTQYERECVICGENDNLVAFQKYENTAACRNCDKLASLGTKIARIHGSDEKYLIVVREDRGEGTRLPSTGQAKYLDIKPLDQVEANMKMDSEFYKRVYSINEPMIGLDYSTNLWIGNYNKRHEDMRAFEFAELASKSCGIKRLGVMRADVDDLGNAFTSGFEKKNWDKGKYDTISFSRSATFSREMTMFFNYEINKLCDGSTDDQFGFRLPGSDKNLIGKEKNIVIVYSGGDDIFAVGPWDEILEFSVNLNDAFKEFSLGKLSISAGIGLFPKGFPISQMARQTGELEEAAKAYRNSSKNAIALFDGNNDDYVFSWDRFKSGVCLDKMEKLTEWFYFDSDEAKDNPEKLYAGASFLDRLYGLFSSKDEINIARLAYQIGRIKPSNRYTEKLETYDKIKKELYGWILDWEEKVEAVIAINLIILLNRSKKED